MHESTNTKKIKRKQKTSMADDAREKRQTAAHSCFKEKVDIARVKNSIHSPCVKQTSATEEEY